MMDFEVILAVPITVTGVHQCESTTKETGQVWEARSLSYTHGVKVSCLVVVMMTFEIRQICQLPM
jgi:hypothetical protein